MGKKITISFEIDEEFENLIKSIVVQELEKKYSPESVEKKWILSDETMRLLGISSRTTLQKLRDEGKLRFSCPGGKIYFYDRESIMDYIESRAVDTF